MAVIPFKKKAALIAPMKNQETNRIMTLNKEEFEGKPPKYCSFKGDNLYLAIHIQTKASKNKIVGQYGDRLKIQIAAPPIEGKANEELIKFLAKYFAVPRSQISITKGLHGQSKLVQIKNQAKEIVNLKFKTEKAHLSK